MTPEDLREKAQLTPEVLQSFTPVEPPMRKGDSGKDVHGKGEFCDPDDDGTQSRQTLPPACAVAVSRTDAVWRCFSQAPSALAGAAGWALSAPLRGWRRRMRC